MLANGDLEFIATAPGVYGPLYYDIENDASGYTSANITITVLSLDDNDGVDALIEDAAPNNGDGNDDGMPDSEQSDVASLPTEDGYVTVEISGTGCEQLDSVYTTTESAIATQDPDHDYPLGLVGFEAACVGSLTVKHYWYGADESLTYEYLKYGPTTPGDASTTTWYNWPAQLSTQTIDGEHVLIAEYTLTDGELGDDTGVDGVIFDPAGPTAVVEQAQDPDDEPTGPTQLIRTGGVAQ